MFLQEQNLHSETETWVILRGFGYSSFINYQNNIYTRGWMIGPFCIGQRMCTFHLADVITKKRILVFPEIYKELIANYESATQCNVNEINELHT